MSNTLLEISQCPKANYDFWTEQANFALQMYKSTGKFTYRMLFRRAIHDRRNQTLLEQQGKQQHI